MRMRRAQVAFSAGELDPKLKGRRDTAIFPLGCEHLRNSLVRQQGSTFVRPGSSYLRPLRDSASDPNGPFVRLLPFVFNNAQRYLVAITHQSAVVIRQPDNVTISEIVTPWTAQELAAIDYIQIGDTMLLAHENYPIQQIQRQFDGSFTTEPFLFDFPPQFRIQEATKDLVPSDVTGTITLTSLDGAVFKPRFDELGAAAPQASVGDLWTFRGKRFQIISVASNGASASVLLLDDLPDTDPSGIWTEQAAAVQWGYHRSLAYFQDRLWIGGAASLPVGIWASRTGIASDFFATTTNDDEPFQFNVGDGRIEPVMYLQPGAGGLEVYTAGSEGLIPGSTTEPITPATVRYVSQSSFGIRQVKPIRLSANTLFVDRAGTVRELVFSDLEQNYQAIPIAIRSSHLVPNIVRATAAPGGFGEQIDFALFLNANGVGAALTFEKSQEVVAWAEVVQSRAMLDWVAVGDTIYVATKQGNRVHLQVFDRSARFDNQVTVNNVTPSATVSGLTHLASSTAEVFADGYWLGPMTVSSAGVVTLPEPATRIEVGTPIDWLIQPMPVESENQSLLGRAIRPFRAEVRFATSAGLRVNEQPIYDRPFDDVTNTPPQATSDVRRVHLLGWSRGASAPIRITREGPFPVEILAFAIDYRVGGSS